MLPPHWLDEVLENVRDADEVLHVLLDAPEMRTIADEVFAAGERRRKLIERTPKLVGPSPAQVMREEFLRRLNTPVKEDALVHTD